MCAVRSVSSSSIAHSNSPITTAAALQVVLITSLFMTNVFADQNLSPSDDFIERKLAPLGTLDLEMQCRFVQDTTDFARDALIKAILVQEMFSGFEKKPNALKKLSMAGLEFEMQWKRHQCVDEAYGHVSEECRKTHNGFLADKLEILANVGDPAVRNNSLALSKTMRHLIKASEDRHCEKIQHKNKATDARFGRAQQR